MGREIRRVPPNWEHPKTDDKYRPMFDEDYESAAKEWADNYELWKAGMHPAQSKPHPTSCKYFWEYDMPPEQDGSYREKFTEEPTWFQVYETVSEGTPVTPPFATKEELVDYLVAKGDFWDQKRWRDQQSGLRSWNDPDPKMTKPGWDRDAAKRFVDSECSPSMMIKTSTETPTVILEPRDGIIGHHSLEKK
jgi:hypothetical protein